MSEFALLMSGSSGKIGQALIASLHDDQCDLFFMKADTKLYSITGEYINDQEILSYSKVNFVHLASPDEADCRTNPITALNVNFKLVENLLVKPYAQKITNIIFTSTTRIYGDNVTSQVEKMGSVRIENEYAAVKYLTERMLQQIWQDIKIKPNIYALRVANVASVLCVKQKRRPLINEFCWNAAKYNEITINNQKNLIKNFIHIQDVCASINKLLYHERVPEFVVLNVTSDQYFSLFDIADKIKKYFSFKYGREIAIKHKFKGLQETKSDITIARNRVNESTRDPSLSIDHILYAQIDKYSEFFNG